MTEATLQRAGQHDVKPQPIPADIRTKPQWCPFRDPARVWLNADMLFPRYQDQMKGTSLANRAIQYLSESRERPFALWISSMEPH